MMHVYLLALNNAPYQTISNRKLVNLVVYIISYFITILTWKIRNIQAVIDDDQIKILIKII